MGWYWGILDAILQAMTSIVVGELLVPTDARKSIPSKSMLCNIKTVFKCLLTCTHTLRKKMFLRMVVTIHLTPSPLASFHFYYLNYLKMTFFSVSVDLVVCLERKMRKEGEMVLQENSFMMFWESQMYSQLRILIVLLGTVLITTINLHMRSSVQISWRQFLYIFHLISNKTKTGKWIDKSVI